MKNRAEALKTLIRWTGEEKIDPSSPRFQNAVQVIMDDDSMFLWQNAFAHKLDDFWYGVVTEHYGYHVFNKEDVMVIRTYPYDRPAPEKLLKTLDRATEAVLDAAKEAREHVDPARATSLEGILRKYS